MRSQLSAHQRLRASSVILVLGISCNSRTTWALIPSSSSSRPRGAAGPPRGLRRTEYARSRRSAAERARAGLASVVSAACIGGRLQGPAERLAMEYITLPGTELKVSRICLGTMQFSNSWEWPCDQATATAVVDAAIQEGINFFDTAQVRWPFGCVFASYQIRRLDIFYRCIVGERACATCPSAQAYQVDGDRCSEKMLGIALGPRRGDVVIASKFGLHVGEDQTVFDGVAVTQAIDDTLAALGTDYLDLMQIHWPGNIGYIGEESVWPAANEVVAALEGAVAAGKLKYYGCCNFGTTDLAAFVAAGGKPVSNQLPYNLLFRTIESGILPLCIDKNMGVLTYSSLQQALLTGKFTDPVSCLYRRCELYTHSIVCFK